MTGTTISPAVLARLSLATGAAVDSCGGVEGAGRASGRSKSTAGRWSTTNEPDQPPLDAALAMDRVVMLQGRAPPILTAMARELGHVAIRLPDAPEGASAWHQGIGQVSAQVGEAVQSICAALADDGDVSGREVRRLNIVGEIDDAIAEMVKLREMAKAKADAP